MASSDTGPRILVTVWILVALSAVFLALRLYCKVAKHRSLWWDDHVLIASWVTFLLSAVGMTCLVRLGFGKHEQDIPPDNLALLPLVMAIEGTFSILAVTLSKTSFAITLLRIVGRRMKLFVWAIIIVMNVLFVANILFMWLRCIPIEKLLHPEIYGACLSTPEWVNYSITVAAFSGVMDCLLALLPWKVVWKLQMKVKEKIGVAVAMSMGIFAGVTGIVKAVMLKSLGSKDLSYYGADLFVWGAAETAVTIIAASIPILRVLVSDIHSSARKYHTQHSEAIATSKAGIITNRTQTRTIIQSERPDDASERSIIAATGRGIMATSEIEVEYQRAGSDGDSFGYEMESV